MPVEADFEPDPLFAEAYGALMAALRTAFDSGEDDSVYLQELKSMARNRAYSDEIIDMLYGVVLGLLISVQLEGYDIDGVLATIGARGALISEGINPDEFFVPPGDEGLS